MCHLFIVEGRVKRSKKKNQKIEIYGGTLRLLHTSLVCKKNLVSGHELHTHTCHGTADLCFDTVPSFNTLCDEHSADF